MGRGSTAVSDGTSVWTFVGGSSPKAYDATHTIYPNAESDDVFVAKYAASDGTGQWATSIGGTAKDRFADATMTPAGPVYVGYGQSDSVALGGLSIDNLQHRAAQAAGQIGTRGLTRRRDGAFHADLRHRREPAVHRQLPDGRDDRH